MPNNQNPVFTDNTTILGDGTEENPLVGVGGGASPGGAKGDAQFNDGSGGFASAAELTAGWTFEIDSSGNLQIIAPAGKFISIIGPGGVVIDGSGAIVAIQREFGQGDTTLGNLANAVLAKGGRFNIANVQTFANNAAAVAGGLVSGDVYKNGADPDLLCIVD